MEAPKAPNPRSLLVVDDEEDILLSIESLVEHAFPGTRVRTALSGPQALALLREAPVDLVVSDYKMPEMDGITFLRAAAELAPGARRLLISAFVDANLERRARAEAGVPLVHKSVDAETFVRVLDSLLRHADGAGAPT